jgi:AcrR family transcriptional regulator
VTQVVEVAGNDGPGGGAAGQPTRRDRLRAATTGEIIQTARDLLVASGPEAVSLRAIAREMGMTAPGLYRYFGSHTELVRHVCASIFTELGEDIRRAIMAADSGDHSDPDRKTEHLTLKMVAACLEFRRWALDHKAEFTLLFAVPLPSLDDGRYDVADECALAFAGVFVTLFLELWSRAPFPVPGPEEIDPVLCAQLVRYRDKLGADIPVGAVLTFLRCWTVLYGAVAMEVFGHMSFALDNTEPMFDIILGDLASLVGLRYPLRP